MNQIIEPSASTLHSYIAYLEALVHFFRDSKGDKHGNVYGILVYYA